MSIGFGRLYELTLWSPEHTYDVVDIEGYTTPTVASTIAGLPDLSPPTREVSQPAGSRKLIIKDKEINADVVYSTESKSGGSNSTNIKMTNLTDTEINFIRKNGYAILKAGYQQPNLITQKGIDGVDTSSKEFLPIVFIGQITKVYTQDAGTDRITTIICADSQLLAREKKISKTYAPNTTYKSIILDLMDEAVKIGISYGNFVETGVVQEDSGYTPNSIAQDELANTTGVIRKPARIKPTPELVLNNGYVAQGTLRSVLSEVCDAIGYKYFISLGRLYVEPKSYPNRASIVEVTGDNIIGNPQFQSDSSGKTTQSSDAQDGVSVTIFLNGSVTVDKKLLLRDELLGGYYTITSVTHRVNLEAPSEGFTTTIVGKRV